MFCPKCGNELPDTAAFCNACGATIEKKAPSDEPTAKSTANLTVKKTGLGVNPIVIGGIAVVVVLIVVFVVAIRSCSSSSDGGEVAASSPSASATSSATTGSSSSGSTTGATSINATSKFTGTWRDPDYGDTMEIGANGNCVINQKGVGTTYWTWEEVSDGIRIKNSANTYVLSYGYANGRETLYNNSKGLKFQR